MVNQTLFEFYSRRGDARCGHRPKHLSPRAIDPERQLKVSRWVLVVAWIFSPDLDVEKKRSNSKRMPSPEAMLEAKRQHAEPLAALRATGLGYVKFALSFPTEFRFMFRRDLGISSRPDSSRPDASRPDASQSEHLQRASSAAYQVLLDAILECQQAGLLAENDPQVMAMSAWSTTHGLASIILDGPVGTQLRDLEQAEPLAEAVLRTLMRGLERR
jgi:AcrR family transcriptional regulator